MMIEIQDTLVSTDLLTEYFCCNLEACKGACCVEGDAGAPVMEEEIEVLEKAADKVWPNLLPEAQDVILRQGVVYVDITGDLVTNIVRGRDCVFARQDNNQCTMCAIQKCKPISCSLYPVRLSKVGSMTALNYHRWDVCNAARELGKSKGLFVYQFLRQPLIRRFGQAWYDELELVKSVLDQSQTESLTTQLT